MVTRGGHSLPELLVAVTLLGTTIGAIATAGIHAFRTTMDAVQGQEALSLAALCLDSLLLSPDPRSGERVAGAYALRWIVEPDGAGRSVRVRAVARRQGGAARAAARLQAFWIQTPHAVSAFGGTSSESAGGAEP